MAHTGQPIPLRLPPVHRPGSPLRSPSNPDDVGRAWSKNAETAAHVAELAHNIAQMQRELARLRRARGGGTSSGGAPVWLP